MKKSEIQVGGLYVAKVAANLTTVRVDSVKPGYERGDAYAVTNLVTGRKTSFRSAAKFRAKVRPCPACKLDVVYGCRCTKEERERQLTAAVAAPVASAYTLDEEGNEVSEDEQRPDPTPSTTPATSQPPTQPRCLEPVKPAAAPLAANTEGKPVGGIASRLREAQVAAIADDAPHLIVEALAGTGKTTTLIEGLKVLQGQAPGIVPSPQQRRVWDELCRSKGKARTIGFVAFNRSIAEELKSRVPAGVDAMTMHSLGFAAVRRAFRRRLEVSQWRVQDIIGDLLGKDIREVKKKDLLMVNAVEQLVGLCKMNLAETTPDALAEIAAYYDVDSNGAWSQICELVPQVIERCKDPERDGRIDYDDMIWLPVALNLSVAPYDLLLVDEAQDLNRCQQSLAKRSGKRLVFVGDKNQAIYGFCGADAESLPRLKAELSDTERGCEAVPLTVTRRCGKAIVDKARQYVPEFEAHETNGEGKVTADAYKETAGENGATKCYRGRAAQGDMVLCRVNAPLVSQCFKFIRAGVKANIQGRDIGKGLVSTVTKLKAANVGDLIGRLGDWLAAETKKESAKRNPSETRIAGFQDRYDCLMCFTEGLAPESDTDAVIQKINSVFTDDKNSPGVRLSSIHRAKGLESKRVFWLCIKEATMREDKMQEWERGQERNLRYVACTRAIEELVIVS